MKGSWTRLITRDCSRSVSNSHESPRGLIVLSWALFQGLPGMQDELEQTCCSASRTISSQRRWAGMPSQPRVGIENWMA